jgi:uroporphyrinogen-III decarboxylase
MSFEDGWAAINLEMPARIPRTEYSAESYHWPLVSAVTGREVTASSPPHERRAASVAFMTAWRYDFCWSTLIGSGSLGDYETDMGHAVYAADGSDYRPTSAPAFATPEEVLRFDPLAELPFLDHADLVARFSEHYRANCARFPDAVNMTGIYITIVSGLIAMLGWELLLLTAGTDPDRFGAFTRRYAEWVRRFAVALAESEAPIVMIHDDMVWTSGPFIAPEWYRTFVFPSLAMLLEPLREAGKKIAFTSDGDYTLFIDDLAQAGVDGFVFEPMTDLGLIAERYGRTHFLIGNADTRILLSGSREEIRAEVERCIGIGRDCPGYFLAVGNHIPANTPVENALYYNECYEELMWR